MHTGSSLYLNHDVMKMKASRYCPECDAEMIHHSGNGYWECPNGECPIFHIKLSQFPIKGNLRRISRIVYATVL